MIRIYLIVTLCLFTFLACTNSANSNNPEEAATAEKSMGLENAIGNYEMDFAAQYTIDGTPYRIKRLTIFESGDGNYGFAVYGSWKSSSFDFLDERDYQPWSASGRLDTVINRRWTYKLSDSWHIVIPQEGFSEDLKSVVLVYENSSSGVQAYPFDKVN